MVLDKWIFVKQEFSSFCTIYSLKVQFENKPDWAFAYLEKRVIGRILLRNKTIQSISYLISLKSVVFANTLGSENKNLCFN